MFNDPNEKSVRTNGAVLVGRKDSEYWFIDSVFRHGSDFYGCTGMTVYPVSVKQTEYDLDPENMADSYCEHWMERYKDSIKSGCRNCRCGVDEDGCENCGYPSLLSFCAEVVQYDGYDAVYDYPGGDYKDALEDLLVSDDDPDCVETVSSAGCGRIFGRTGLDDFDEVYNRKALVACLAYEDGAVDYDYARRVIFGE